jgi:hypothetical protein
MPFNGLIMPKRDDTGPVTIMIVLSYLDPGLCSCTPNQVQKRPVGPVLLPVPTPLKIVPGLSGLRFDRSMRINSTMYAAFLFKVSSLVLLNSHTKRVSNALSHYLSRCEQGKKKKNKIRIDGYISEHLQLQR